MEEIIEVNKGLLSDTYLVMTNKGWVKASELRAGRKIIDITGKVVKIEKIRVCGKRPDAPILGKTSMNKEEEGMKKYGL